MAEGPPKRQDFPMSSAGRGQWLKAKKAYAKAKGTHVEERSERGETEADETVEVGPGRTGEDSEDLARRSDETQPEHNARVERALRRRAGGPTTTDAAKALRRRK